MTKPRIKITADQIEELARARSLRQIPKGAKGKAFKNPFSDFARIKI